MEFFNTGTIPQTLAHLKADGFYVAENALRAWVKQGLIPARHCGPRAYIYYPNVIAYLQGGDEIAPEETEYGKIRRIM